MDGSKAYTVPYPAVRQYQQSREGGGMGTTVMEKSVKDNGKESAKPAKAQIATEERPLRTLVIDIGATGLKAVVLNEISAPITERARVKTPASGMPGEVMDALTALAQQQGEFDRVSVGFPGIIRNGVVKDAPNLAKEWKDFNIGEVLAARLGKPVRVANDADVQGFGAISGKGVELVLTLGTGVGSSLFVNGHLVPNVEVGRKKLSDAELQKVGKGKWNRRLTKTVKKLEKMFHYDRLYIGGGNARVVDIGGHPAHVTIVSNLNGLVGGLALWREHASVMSFYTAVPSPPASAEAEGEGKSA
jgi:polyphosphate glucokinase